MVTNIIRQVVKCQAITGRSDTVLPVETFPSYVLQGLRRVRLPPSLAAGQPLEPRGLAPVNDSRARHLTKIGIVTPWGLPQSTAVFAFSR